MKNFNMLMVVVLSINLLLVIAHTQHETKGDKYENTKHDINPPSSFESHNSIPDKNATSYEKPKEGTPLTKEDNQNHPEPLSCVLLKSFVYGVQKAVDEYAAGNHDSNLSRAVRDINVGSYLTNFCPPASSSKPTKRSITKPDDIHMKNDLPSVAEEYILVKPSYLYGNDKKEMHDLNLETKINKAERLDRMDKLITTFEEVANAFKLMQGNNNQIESGHTVKNDNKPHHSGLSIARKQENSLPVQEKNNKVEKSEKNESITNANHQLPEDNFNQNASTLNVQTKARHYHYHGKHMKHAHVHQIRTKSKTAPVEIDDNDDNTYDDRYVAERIKQEEKQQAQQVKETKQEIKNKENRKVSQVGNEKNIYDNKLKNGQEDGLITKHKQKSKRSVDKQQAKQENKHFRSKMHQKRKPGKGKSSQKKSKHEYKNKI